MIHLSTHVILWLAVLFALGYVGLALIAKASSNRRAVAVGIGVMLALAALCALHP
jgi:hypothetical protein